MLSVVVSEDGVEVSRYSVESPKLSDELRALLDRGVRAQLDMVSRAAMYDERVKTIGRVMPKQCPDVPQGAKAVKGNGAGLARFCAKIQQ